MAPDELTALDAATALHDLREARADTGRRAAGLSMMVWALVLTSMAGSMIAAGLAQFVAAGVATGEADGPDSWTLFMLSEFALLVFWVSVGTLMQRLVLSSFSVRRAPGETPWKSALLAAAVVVGSVFLFGAGQDLTRMIQGIGTTPDQYDALHHNLGTAMSLTLAGTVFLAMVVGQGGLGVPKARAAFVAGSAFVVAHLTTFLWFPDLGTTGAVSAALLLPVGLILFGLRLWRQG